jgi:hypothetical protein
VKRILTLLTALLLAPLAALPAEEKLIGNCFFRAPRAGYRFLRRGAIFSMALRSLMLCC